MKRKTVKLMALAISVLMLMAMLPTVALAAVAPGDVCSIGDAGYSSLGAALEAVQDGDTIKLLTNIDYLDQIRIENMSITFDLNHQYTLSLESTLYIINNGGIKTINGILGVAELNISCWSQNAVNITNGGIVDITGNLVSVLGYGLRITSDQYNLLPAYVDIDGSISSRDSGVTVVAPSSSEGVEIAVNITGDVMSTAYNTVAISAAGPLTLVNVEGNVTSVHNGVYASNGATITIGGDVTARSSIPGSANAVSIWYTGGIVIVEGIITWPLPGDPDNTNGSRYISLNENVDKEDCQPVSSKACYIEYYRDFRGPELYGGECFVWVKDPSRSHVPGSAADCTHNQVCLDCGKVLTKAFGHAWGEWAVTTLPSCEIDGVETRICANDASHTETKPIPALGHTPGECTVIKAPTRTEKGEWEIRCEVCDELLESGEIDELVITDPITNVDCFATIQETAKGSKVWEVTFTVTLSLIDEDGEVVGSEVVEYVIYLDGNNSNLSGSYTFADDHDLAGYTLVYDIKGNGSNIKEFSIIKD